MYTIQDGARVLKFEGQELAQSSSQEPGKTRWVEFSLYRTRNGKYVVGRVGVSMTFHKSSCAVVKRNNIDPLPAQVISSNLQPCRECSPSREAETYLYAETPRHRAQICTTARGVVDSLKQYDSRNTEYITDVARRLLEDAAKIDEDISDAFYVEYL